MPFVMPLNEKSLCISNKHRTWARKCAEKKFCMQYNAQVSRCSDVTLYRKKEMWAERKKLQMQ